MVLGDRLLHPALRLILRCVGEELALLLRGTKELASLRMEAVAGCP